MTVFSLKFRRILLILALSGPISGRAETAHSVGGHAEPGEAARGQNSLQREMGDQNCLYGDWRLEGVSGNAPMVSTMRFGRNQVLASSPSLDVASDYEFIESWRETRIRSSNPRILRNRSGAGMLLPRNTGDVVLSRLTNNVLSFRTSDGTASTYRKVVPRRNYLVVHAQNASVTEGSPGHMFIQTFSLDAGNRRLIDNQAWGFYPATLDKAGYTRWHEIRNGTPGDLRNEYNDPVLLRNGHRFYSDDMFIVEISDRDLGMIRQLILDWNNNPRVYHGTSNNCITFVLLALTLLEDRTVELGPRISAFPSGVLEDIRILNTRIELGADDLFNRDGYIPCLAGK